MTCVGPRIANCLQSWNHWVRIPRCLCAPRRSPKRARANSDDADGPRELPRTQRRGDPLMADQSTFFLPRGNVPANYGDSRVGARLAPVAMRAPVQVAMPAPVPVVPLAAKAPVAAPGLVLAVRAKGAARAAAAGAEGSAAA